MYQKRRIIRHYRIEVSGGKYLAIKDYVAVIEGGGKRWRIQGRNMGTL
jgi:hypothetical protein